jgi:hypothetical protein
MITATDITDSTFQSLTTEQKVAYLGQGGLMFTAECLKHSIDEAEIDEALYVPSRMMAVCTLISMCKDMIGSSFREIREGLTIDVYQAKMNTLTDELNELRGNFTPTMCGYEETGDVSGTGSISVSWSRG